MPRSAPPPRPSYLATNPNARYIAVGPGGTVNGGRNTLRLPGINNFDVAFSKRINATPVPSRWSLFQF